jgi:hypothetical protein
MRLFCFSVLASLVLMGGVAHGGNPDPRKCPYSTAKAYCAGYNAKLVARKWLAKKAGQTELWQGPVNCTVVKPILTWRCTYTSTVPAIGNGYLTVTFKATSSGWHTYVTRTMTG